ncbi:MAG: AAA family ATPase [Candidatus Symbiothrix sp.]|jgi:predicted ATP-dependent endonuclease of OLD family|nr:AAA family ATPase [Candidatus Symbiothrix sp.]
MEVNQLRLHIEDFRAIKEADIILNGITVVAGENGSGKSTLSKFLYYAFQNSIEYDELVDKDLKNKLNPFLSFIDDFDRTVFTGTTNRLKDRLVVPDLVHDNPLLSIYDRYQDETYLLKKIDRLFSSYESEKQHIDSAKIVRLKFILQSILEERTTHESNLSYLKDRLKQTIHRYFEEAKDYREKRPLFFFTDELNRIFSTGLLPSNYRITEYESSIINNTDDILERAYTIHQTAYIDTPMLLGHTGEDHWNRINTILYNRDTTENYNSFLNAIISREIIKGEVSVENKYSGIMDAFVYKREDGTRFNLLECATGIKSFAILQMLLKNGFLNKYTLLIIDEPEAHLHPQWIVEFARLIVLLNKHIGVKFFIASHDPDIVAAIKYIGEKEEIDNNLNFYFSQKEDNSFTYTYQHLGTDIGPIFESFNIAFDKINQYSDTQENNEE